MEGPIRWWRIQTRVARNAADAAVDILWQHEPQAVGEAANGSHIELDASFDTETAARDAAHALRSLGANCDVFAVDDEPWLDAWKEHAATVTIDRRLTIVPAWVDPPSEGPGLVITIDPGRAFGHGAHPTTLLAARQVLDALTTGAHVLDVGSGSGVLSVVAARSGAATVDALDIDPAAVEATSMNAAANAVGDRIAAQRGSIDAVDGIYDVVVANIGANVLIELAPALMARLRPDGVALLGGFLADRAAAVEAAYAAVGGEASDRLEDEGWAALTIRRAGS